MGMKVSLRPIVEDDLEWARLLRNANRKLFFDSRVVSRSMQREWFRGLSHPFFVVEYDRGRVGTVSVRQVPGGHEIHNVLIENEYRRKGAFKEILAILEKTYGVPLFVNVKPDNQEAIRVYTRLGFTPTALRMQKG